MSGARQVTERILSHGQRQLRYFSILVWVPGVNTTIGQRISSVFQIYSDGAFNHQVINVSFDMESYKMKDCFRLGFLGKSIRDRSWWPNKIRIKCRIYLMFAGFLKGLRCEAGYHQGHKTGDYLKPPSHKLRR